MRQEEWRPRKPGHIYFRGLRSFSTGRPRRRNTQGVEERGFAPLPRLLRRWLQEGWLEVWSCHQEGAPWHLASSRREATAF